ncbi:MAG TPA: biotin/lipoyl-containing protein [Anaerolineales bacterium]|nr:biotin/lipoyl-containing protein [Anaerolineales bacterium]
MKYIAEVDGLEFPVEIVDEHHVRFGDEVLEVDLAAVSGEPLYSLIVNGESFEGYVYPDEDHWQVHLLGQFYQIRVEDEREKRLRAASQVVERSGAEYVLKAPMPGLLISVPVSEGQSVQKGEILLILESMKMQNELRAPFDGKIARLRVKPGETVQQKQILLNLVAEPAAKK